MPGPRTPRLHVTVDVPLLKVMSVRQRFLTVPAAAACVLLALTGCEATGTERPDPRPSVSPEVATPVETPDSAPAITLVDVSPGGPVEGDPVWSGLRTAAADGEDAYLDVYVHSYQEPGGEGEVTLTPSTPDSVSITVPAEAVDAERAPFYRILGTFAVTEVGSSAYTLEAASTDEITEVRPTGPSTEERCTAEDANERIGQAAQQLADDPGSREELRLLWASAPEVWWGIQRTAATLGDSEGEAAGDFLTEACGAHLG